MGNPGKVTFGLSCAIFLRCPLDHTMKAFMGRLMWSSLGMPLLVWVLGLIFNSWLTINNTQTEDYTILSETSIKASNVGLWPSKLNLRGVFFTIV